MFQPSTRSERERLHSETIAMDVLRLLGRNQSKVDKDDYESKYKVKNDMLQAQKEKLKAKVAKLEAENARFKYKNLKLKDQKKSLNDELKKVTTNKRKRDFRVETEEPETMHSREGDVELQSEEGVLGNQMKYPSILKAVDDLSIASEVETASTGSHSGVRPILRRAQEFKQYWEQYSKLHAEVSLNKDVSPAKKQTLQAMHQWLEKIKKGIWDDEEESIGTSSERSNKTLKTEGR